MSLLVVVRLKVVSNKVWPDKMMLAALNFIFANRNEKPSLSSNQENKKATKTISLCHLIIPRTRGKYQQAHIIVFKEKAENYLLFMITAQMMCGPL